MTVTQHTFKENAIAFTIEMLVFFVCCLYFGPWPHQQNGYCYLPSEPVCDTFHCGSRTHSIVLMGAHVRQLCIPQNTAFTHTPNMIKNT